ncbi:MAG: alpha/beta hydrolase [Pyrinomonadaceae bacterium]
MKKGISICLFLLVLFAEVKPQTPSAASTLASNVTEAKLASKLMGRPMPYRVILPEGYLTDKERRYPAIYLLHGLFGSSENWTTLAKLPTYAKNYQAIIVNPEGENGWYVDSPTVSSNRYESYIIKELIPEIDAKYRTNASRSGRAMAGLSMGGYGALKFGVKYPEVFSLVGSFSGALGAATFTSGGPVMEAIFKSINESFGPIGSETRKSNDLFGLVREASPEKIKTWPFMYLDCGTEDFLFSNNRDFATLLSQKKVPHEYRELPGGHTWPYWDKQVTEFLRLSEKFTK